MANREKFGQVFTSEKVAKSMVALIRPFLNNQTKCLDPCLGKNVFLSEVSKHEYGTLVGVELDEMVIDSSVKDFYEVSNRQLIRGDFFDLSLNKLFDVIIMNPPYVRQELLGEGINAKGKIASIFGEDYSKIPGKSNLYVYFLLKALKHLKKDGVLVAITYDSWLFTDFGRKFKDILFNTCSLEKIVHFKTGVFDNVNVGATILLLGRKKDNKKIEYYPLDSPTDLANNGNLPINRRLLVSRKDIIDFHRLHANIIDFNAGVFQPISILSKKPIVRGISGKVNRFFIFDTDRFRPYTMKIVKEVASIKKFDVGNDFKYLLKLSQDVSDKNVKDHLENILNEVEKNPESYKSLRACIQNDSRWFSIKGEVNGNIIFNYYIRDKIHFMHNSQRYLVADNFYSLCVDKKIYANFCVLNSSFTRLALLKFGKSQGRGLFKIQLGQFKNIPIIDLNKLKGETVKTLTALGKQLCQTERAKSQELLQKVDVLLLSEINPYLSKKISLAQLNKEIESIKGKKK